jgi:hypothetical protein
MKKIILVLFFVIFVLVVGCEPLEDIVEEVEEQEDSVEAEDVGEEPTIDQDDVVSPPIEQKDNRDKEKIGFGDITKHQCEEAGGHWNECGSPCAGTDAEICIQVCQVQCECRGIAGFECPEGYKCRLSGKVADEIGVCVEE